MDDQIPEPRDHEQDEDSRAAEDSAWSERLYSALAQSGPPDDVEALAAVKARIRRSLDDPRPSLSLGEIDDFVDGLVVRARADARRA